MNYKVSVIIPCYNSEKTLERSIKSVINQSIGFENIELILYDDASTDSTTEIIKKYSNEYKNIIPIFSKKNSGFPGKGRNTGINKSTSEYIMFMDNDDEYESHICENLYNEIIESKADLVSSSYINIDEVNTNKIQTPCHYGREINNKIIFSSEETIYFMNRMIWTCIFKKRIVQENGIHFPEDNLAEDVYFIIYYLLYANKVVYLKEYYGLYRHVQNYSLSHSLNLYKLNRLFDIYEEILEVCDNKNFDCNYILGDKIAITLMQLYTSNAINEKTGDVYNLFTRIKNLERKINYKSTLDPILNIVNNLICNNHFKLAIIYFNILQKAYSSKSLILLYRMTIQKLTH